MTSPLSFPSQPQASPSGTGMQDLKSTLGVNDSSSQQMSAERMKRQQIESVQAQISEITNALDGIATQFPAASRGIKDLQAGLTKVLVLIVGSSMLGSQPSTGGMG